jgi:branched-chain amino acid aminotransferase
MGDGIWEGLRLHHGRVPFLADHLDRLMEGARALDLNVGRTREQLADAVRQTVEANHMRDGVHMRLMVTRGIKRTPFQDPSVNLGPATLVITAEYKSPHPDVVASGIRLSTVHVRRGRPDVQDPALNSHSKLNCITACIAAQKAGADEGLMLDPHGFVATCNSTHFFIVRRGELWTSTGRYCLRGITRGHVLRVAREEGLTALECDFSLTQVYGADEAFVTGTFAGIVPVRSVDGRAFEDVPGPVTRRLTQAYAHAIRKACEQSP